MVDSRTHRDISRNLCLVGQGKKNKRGRNRHPVPVTNGGGQSETIIWISSRQQASGSRHTNTPLLPYPTSARPKHIQISTPASPKTLGGPVLPACFHGNKIKLRDERSVWWWCTGGQGAEESSSSGVGASPRYTRLRLCPELSRLRLPSPSLNRKYVITHLK